MTQPGATSDSPINVLLIGGGGREHAMAKKIAASPRLGTLYTTHPENPGLASLAKPVDVPVSIREIYRLQQFIEKKSIGLIVIGPEEPLAEGFADKLRSPTTLVFGPGAEAARLEADKAWAKQLMRAASIPTGESRAFTDAESAIAYITSRPQPPVVKAAGLAKGKGVIVPETTEEAVEAIRRIMIKKEFGEAGRQVVLEERLRGPEASVLAIVDGRNILILPPAQDHKRLNDGDTGPNTGGMGVFCPTTLVDDALMAKVEREVLVPTVDALRREGYEYCGVLYAGLMLTHAGPKVLEFNCRFGDPECQTILARLKGDLLTIILAACRGTLDQVDVEWDARPSCCVVLAAEGYPEKPKSGAVIHGIDRADAMPDVDVFHAGTKRLSDGSIVTAGGRVLNVVAVGDTLADARAKAYAAAEIISFQGKQFRTDIGIAPPR
jgi:phosphoribosylamine--glycine ligase